MAHARNGRPTFGPLDGEAEHQEVAPYAANGLAARSVSIAR
jgi:hypothetical protein